MHCTIVAHLRFVDQKNHSCIAEQGVGHSSCGREGVRLGAGGLGWQPLCRSAIDTFCKFDKSEPVMRSKTLLRRIVHTDIL